MRQTISYQWRWAVAALMLVMPMAGFYAVAQTPPPASSDAQLRKAFDAADENKDGVINIDESVADAVHIFFALDKNKDRFLTFDELPGYDPNRLKRADRDGDGKLSLSEVVADRVWEFFEADTNHDGVVSFEEVRLYVLKTRPARK